MASFQFATDADVFNDTGAAQRMFAKLASPPTSGIPALIEGIRSLWIVGAQLGRSSYTC